MPIDLGEFIDSFQRGSAEIPRVAIALLLLAGPTSLLVGYRLISAARRRDRQATAAAPLWVCHDCRAVNELRRSQCYHCGAAPDKGGEIEWIVEAPAARPSTFEAPAGSPFAALGVNPEHTRPTHDVPVMTDQHDWVAVGPGTSVQPDGEVVVARGASEGAASRDASDPRETVATRERQP
jgi:hypothetical protein